MQPLLAVLAGQQHRRLPGCGSVVAVMVEGSGCSLVVAVVVEGGAVSGLVVAVVVEGSAVGRLVVAVALPSGGGGVRGAGGGVTATSLELGEQGAGRLGEGGH